MKNDIDLSQKLTLSVPETALALGVSTRVAYELVRRADFPAFKISPSRVVVSKAALEEWIQKQLKDKEI